MITWKISFENKINEVLKEHKRKYGVNKSWIAERMGMSLQSLASLENSTNPTILNLEKLSVLLNRPVKDFYDIKIELIEHES